MWYENVFVDQARVTLGVPLSPLWIASSATAVEVGGGRPPVNGHFYAFGSMCAFLSADATICSGAAAPTSFPSTNAPGVAHAATSEQLIDAGDGAVPHAEEVVFRISYDSVEAVFAEGDNALRVIARGSVFKFIQVEERATVLNAVQWLVSNGYQSSDLDEIGRSCVMYPEASRKVRALTSRPEQSAEYVLQDIDGAIVTNHRLLFSTTVVKLASIQLMHIGEADLKIIISPGLVVQLRCSQQRQALVSSVWLASLPIWTDLLERVPQDPQKALKAHVKTLSRLHRLFCAIDTSRDGRLSQEEVRRAIGCLFFNRAFVDGFFQALDTDCNDEITLTEFLGGISRLVTSDMIGRIRFSFQMYDKDHSGYLDKDEFVSALQILFSTGDVQAHEDELKAVCDDLFDLMDTDHSGTISVEEYTDALLTNAHVHTLFRRVGLYDGADYFLLRLAEDPVGVWSKSWLITAAVMQALLAGLHARMDDVVASDKSAVANGQPLPTLHQGGAASGIGPLEPESYVAKQRMFLNVSPETLEAYGEPYEDDRGGGEAPSPRGGQAPDVLPQHSGMPAVLEVSAPRVFDRIRALHDIQLKGLKSSLGIDNLVGNMLLGSSTLLRPVRILYGDRHRFKFVSHDGMFLVRHVTVAEKARLILNLPQYMTHLLSNPNTLLPRYLGVFSVFHGDRQLHILLQLNAFRQTDARRLAICFHASNYKVPLPPNGVDASELRAPVELLAGWRQPLLRQVAKDVQFLCSVGMSDFALLAAVPSLPVHIPKSLHERGRIFSAALESAAKLPLATSGGWSCCRTVSTRSSKFATARERNDAKGTAACQAPGSQSSYRSAASIMHDALCLVPACRRAVGRSAQQGGIFFSYEHGVPNAQRRPVSFVFVNALVSNPDQSVAYGEALLEQLETMIHGDDEDMVDNTTAMTDTTARLYPITTDTGRQGSIGVDHTQKVMYVVGTMGQRLLCVNLVLAKDALSFAKDLQCYSERNRRRLTIRIGLEASQEDHRDFLKRYEVFFESIVAREMFLSEAREALSGDGRTGAHIRKLRVFSATWNVGERTPGDLQCLMAHVVSHRCDVVAVSLQDCTFPLPGVGTSSCEEHMVSAIANHLPEYDLVVAASVWSTRTIVFVHKKLSQYVSNISTATTGTFLGNANAVGIGFKVFDSSVCIINARFAERGDSGSSTASFYDMMEGLSQLESEGVGVLASYHHVFFCGDLKYRHRAHLNEIIAMSTVDGGSFAPMSRTDQLVEEMARGECFHGFSEACLSFRPTTRFLLGPGSGSNARVYDAWRDDDPPAWSHRVLYRSLGHPVDEGHCLVYDADLSLHSSSCAPVYAVHEISARIQFVVPAVVQSNQVFVSGLRISHLRCSDLIKGDVCQICDPWVKFFFPYFAVPQSTTKTRPQRGTVSPHWPKPFEYPIVPCDRSLLVSEYLHFVVYDEGSSGQKNTLGVATLPLDCLAHHASKDLVLPILLHGRWSGTLSGTVEMLFQADPR